MPDCRGRWWWEGRGGRVVVEVRGAQSVGLLLAAGSEGALESLREAWDWDWGLLAVAVAVDGRQAQDRRRAHSSRAVVPVYGSSAQPEPGASERQSIKQ